jgi:hypothetical protein
LGHRRKPDHTTVHWAVVVVAGLLTLGIGITIVLLSSGGPRGGIVVPQPSPTAAATPPPPSGSSGRIEPAAGTARATTTTPRASTLPGTKTSAASPTGQQVQPNRMIMPCLTGGSSPGADCLPEFPR